MRRKHGFIMVPEYLIECLHPEKYFELVNDIHYTEGLPLKEIYAMLETQYQALGFPKRWASYSSFKRMRNYYSLKKKKELSSRS